MAIFGFDSVADMFDGGGAGGSGDTFSTGSNEDYRASGGTNTEGTTFADRVSNTASNAVSAITGGGSSSYSVQSGDTLSEIARRNNTTVEALMAANPNITNANNIQAGADINIPGGSGGGVRGAAPTGIRNFMATSVIGRVAGWANGLNPQEDSSEVIGNRQVYTSEDGMQYSFNALGMPYEVTVQDGTVVDALSVEGEDGMTGYERMAAEARASGDNDRADAIMAEAEQNANEGGGDADLTNVEAAVERYRAIQAAAGIEVSNDEIREMMNDPETFLADRGMTLADLVPTMDPNAEGTTLDPNDPRYSTSDDITYDPTQITAETVTAPNGQPVANAITDTSADRLNNPQYQADVVTGTIDSDNLVDADSLVIDMEGAATGVNADGTTNYTGVALNDYASQNISRMIDTSTAAGQLLANKLGEGNYTDTKATILGQMDILSAEFKDSSGNPRIPPWAQGVYRNAMRSISFNGVSGSAAIAASANAIMEATLPIAEQEAKFFQTVTLENLDNRQEAIINKAKTLASFDLENLSVRSQAAVQNAKAFLEMDLTNLDNAQQVEIVNTQNRVDAMFTDVAEENVNRRFNITNELENRQFYDNLAFEAATFNASAINAARESNANRADAAAQFNIERTMSRDQFEANMARMIDESNAGWRREVYTTNTRMEFEAAATDVRNALGLTTEGMNRLWDRVDSQLDYIWRSTEADEQRDFELLVAEMTAAANAAAGKASARGSVVGSIIGGIATVGAAVAASDERLKDNIELYDTMPNGVKVYTWEWNEKAKSIGADQTPPFGVIAQEIMKTHPDAVIEGEDGYLRVNYGKIQ